MRRLTYIAMAILFTSFITKSLAHDVDGDGKEGLAEAIHALQVVAGFIVPENTNALCSDGIDNDQDTFVDCDDFDCSQNPSVTICADEENTNALCSDGIDNDQDTFVDCDDFDCLQFPSVCPEAENTNDRCSDGIDNDQDSFIDCDDYDCDATVVCQ